MYKISINSKECFVSMATSNDEDHSASNIIDANGNLISFLNKFNLKYNLQLI